MKITPYNITYLEPNEVFVYGSNLRGQHGAGAAKQALEWGAKIGAIRFSGQTYGISTKDRLIRTLPLYDIQSEVDIFYVFARHHPALEFLVTKIGCGLAGFEPQDIAPLFRDVSKLPNIALPIEFWKHI